MSAIASARLIILPTTSGDALGVGGIRMGEQASPAAASHAQRRVVRLPAGKA